MKPLLFFLWLVPASSSYGVETMRIALGEEESQGVAISGDHLAFGMDAEEAAFHRIASDHARVRVVHRHLELNGAPVIGDSVRFRAGEDSLDAGSPGTATLHVGTDRVRGDLVALVRGERLQLINVLALEDYLAGVLGGEMPVDFPPEALKAQAVAARTYALRKKLDAYGEAFHLGSGVISQVYKGLEHEDPRTRAAVEATRGEVLTHELAPIEAYFHASCGGHTESGREALGRDLPYLQAVECPCGRLASSHWEVTVPREDVEKAARFKGGRLSIISRSPTGRARLLAAGSSREIDAVSLRQRLGYTRLKSLSFEVESAGDNAMRFRGRGYGHGAGMCQWGAKLFAEQTWDYRRILAHYYPGTELQRLY